MASAIRFRTALSACLLMVGAIAVRAQEAVTSSSGSLASAAHAVAPTVVNANTAATTISGGSGITILGYILTVLVLAVAAVAMLFRGGFLGMFTGSSKAERKLHIEESRSLGHRQHLVVASYEGRRFLLGVCPGSIEYLSGLDPEPLAPAGSFQELLSAEPAISQESKDSREAKATANSVETQKDAQ